MNWSASHRGRAAYGLDLLDQSGLLAVLLPEVAAMHGVEQPPEFHPEGDVWTHTRLLLDKLDRATPTLALGALLHDVGKPPVFRVADRIRFDGHVEKGVEMARAILNRLRCSRDDTDQVESLVAHHMHFKDVGRMKENTLKRLMRLPRFDEHLELHRLDCLAGRGNLETYELVKRKWEEMTAEEIKPAPLITGADLIAAGYHRPAFRRDPFRRRSRPIGTPPKHAGRSAGLGAGAVAAGRRLGRVPTRRFGRTWAGFPERRVGTPLGGRSPRWRLTSKWARFLDHTRNPCWIAAALDGKEWNRRSIQRMKTIRSNLRVPYGEMGIAV